MSSFSGRGRRVVTRRPRIHRMAPVRRGGGKTAKCGQVIDNDPDGRILLSNVGTEVDSKVIDEKFGEFGKVNKVIIHCNTNKTRIGTAEVWMSSSKEANKAKSQLNATDIFSDGRIIRIEKPKLLTKLSKFWKTVYKYVSQMNTKIPTEDPDD